MVHSHIQLLLPLCSSSATLGLALFQYPVFAAFIQDDKLDPKSVDSTPKKSLVGRPLSQFWTNVLGHGSSLVLGLSLTTTVSGVFGWNWLKAHETLETSMVSTWYIYGSVLAAVHFMFVPLIANSARKIAEAPTRLASDSEIERENLEEQSRLLTWHTARTLLVDLPAVYCFATGVSVGSWLVDG